MAMLTRPDGEIHYEIHGEGFPVLLFAPGGLRSSIPFWSQQPGGPPRAAVDWTKALPAAGFTVVAMDQRNAGQSRAAIAADHGWQTYAADHMALMDHLGLPRFHVLGSCIGGSFCFKAIATAPQRVVSAVLQNPIGLHPEHTDYFPKSLIGWGDELRATRGDVTPEALEGFGHNMWDDGFVFSVDRDFVQRMTTPCLLLPGSDIPHPAAISAEIATLLPGIEDLDPWRAPDHHVAQEQRVVAFLRAHTPT